MMSETNTYACSCCLGTGTVWNGDDFIDCLRCEGKGEVVETNNNVEDN